MLAMDACWQHNTYLLSTIILQGSKKAGAKGAKGAKLAETYLDSSAMDTDMGVDAAADEKAPEAKSTKSAKVGY